MTSFRTEAVGLLTSNVSWRLVSGGKDRYSPDTLARHLLKMEKDTVSPTKSASLPPTSILATKKKKKKKRGRNQENERQKHSGKKSIRFQPSVPLLR